MRTQNFYRKFRAIEDQARRLEAELRDADVWFDERDRELQVARVLALADNAGLYAKRFYISPAPNIASVVEVMAPIGKLGAAMGFKIAS